MRNLREKVLAKFSKMKEQGVALIVSLLVVLALALLGLTLLLMSSTEQLVAVNEQDATRALGYAETGLDAVNRVVKTFAMSTPAPTSLTDLLKGPDGVSAADDHLPNLGAYLGIPAFRTLDTTKGVSDFRTSNEQTLAGIATIDGKTYEVFRVGEDTDGDGVWDGPRGQVYVRLDDNYDEPTGTADDPLTDEDFRMLLHVVADYPVYVDGSGAIQATNIQQRGTARRRLLGRFEPAGRTAIRTNGDLNVGGNLEVCGACGGVHSNEDLIVSGGTICTEASGTTSATLTSTTADVRGGVAQTGTVFIPKVNPYNSRFVPSPDTFFTANDTSLPDWVKCPGPASTLAAGVTAANYLAKDPGASKYFAFVPRKTNGDNSFRVFKAYWDATNNHWVWRLIDDGNSGNLDALLDNCGRVVSGTQIPAADPIPVASDTTYWLTTTSRPTWAGVGVTDGSTTKFYNSKKHTGGPGAYALKNPACASDTTLSTTDWNDYAQTNWARIPNGSNPWLDSAGDTSIADSGNYTYPTLAAEDPILPGTSQYYFGNWTPDLNPSVDGNRDFVYQDCLSDGKNEVDLNDTAQDIYTPLWGAVIFVYGNITINGGDVVHYVDASGTNTSTNVGAVTDRWRLSLISFGNIDVAGNPVWGPANSAFGITLVAGRDITMGGTAGGGHGNQNQCPDMSAGADCTAPPLNPAGYEGMVLSHEDVSFSGNVTLDGFIIAEDAATCATLTNNVPPNKATGSVQVHYDCVNPPDPWGNRSVQLTSWEEVQQ
jgi:hypothetical protein